MPQVANPVPLVKAVNKIIADPDCWHQAQWHCGSAHCVGGHIEVDSGRPESSNSAVVLTDVREIIGASHDYVSWLTSTERTLPELHRAALCASIGEDYRDPFGYDIHGYDRDGFDRLGYDRDRRDRRDRDREGRDRDGYDVHGFNSRGYDRAGRDCFGYTKGEVPRLALVPLAPEE